MRIEPRRHQQRTLPVAAAAWIACAVVLLGAPPSGWAEPTPEERAQADALFAQARQLVAARRFATACKMFEESNTLAPGRAGTVLNMALCHENDGRTATALTEFRDALRLVRSSAQESEVTRQREQIATEHIARLEPKISHVVINVGASPPTDLDVRLDNQPLPRPSWGTPVPVDPGPHTVEASGPGRPTWNTVVRVRPDGDVQMVSVPGADRAPAKGAPGPRSSTHDARGTSVGEALGYTSIALGIGAVLVGALVGELAISQARAGESSAPLGAVSIGLLGAGALGIGGGVVLLITAPKATAMTRRSGWQAHLQLPWRIAEPRAER